jgi:ParB family chromosome partitioning protein
VAKEHFLSRDGDLETAMLRLGPEQKKREPDFLSNLDATVESVKQLPWTALEQMKGDPDVLKKLEDAEALLKSLRRNIAKEK